MSNVNGILSLTRTAVFGIVSLFALIVLGLAAHIVSEAKRVNDLVGPYSDLLGAFGSGGIDVSVPAFAGLGVATAVFTLLSLPAMLIISFKRSGAVTSYIVVEIAWLSFLWIMWIATAGSAASEPGLNECRGIPMCSQAQAVEALSFLNWIFVLAYSITLLIFAILSHNKGRNDVWTASVREFDFTAKGANHGAVPSSTAGHQFEQKVPNSQGQYPPQGVPNSYTPSPQV